MIYRQFGRDFLVRFDKDELLVEGLLKFFRERAVHPSWVSGLGGALWAEIGFYNLSSKQYTFKKIDKPLEIANLTGNVTWTNNHPSAHLHVTLADEPGQIYAGHLKELTVAGTCELRLQTFDQAVSRKHDDNVGLEVFDL